MKLAKKSKKKDPLKPKFPSIKIKKNEDLILAFPDGSCVGNGQAENTGGYAFILVENDVVLHEYARFTDNTTNNRQELQAIIDCLTYIKQTIPDTQVLLHSDSQYCLHGITTWRHNWIRNDWNQVKNTDLWKVLSKLVDDCPNVQYKWVKGHQDPSTSIEAKWNNYVDSLCTSEEEPDSITATYTKKDPVQAEQLLLEAYAVMFLGENIRLSAYTRIKQYLTDNRLI